MDDVHSVQLDRDEECVGCSAWLPLGTSAYEDTIDDVWCVDCVGPKSELSSRDVDVDRAAVRQPLPELGVAGRSAAREYQRRALMRQVRVRGAHPIAGKAILALSKTPQSTDAWRVGAVGERTIGRRLDRLAAKGVVTLHDRIIPRSRANIDHIAVSPSGVYVIDTKFRSGGKVEVRRTGSFFRPGPVRLVVGGRDGSHLTGSMARQRVVVEAALWQEPEGQGVRFRGLLVFTGAQWAPFARPLAVDQVWIGWPREMARMVSRPGGLGPDQVNAIAALLARKLAPA